ncbi:MAG: clostripain-related cysteine peptidase [Elusimicrobia bacterium]|nr:clostripain-related cysteine peptidase [Elusimicrobiota bacterium]
MIGRALCAVFSGILSVSAVSADDFTLNSDNLGSLSARLSGIEVPAASTAKDKGFFGNGGGQSAGGPAEWTIMVFGNGKNDLERFLIKDMNEMERTGSTPKMNVLVEAGRGPAYDNTDGDWKGVRRYRIVRDRNANKLASPVLADLGNVDMGDYKSVVDFVKWGKSNYPARKYMLILWNHGSGWDRSRAPEKGISYDEVSGNHINTPQLKLMLDEIGHLDVLGSDACLMQMAEVDYEIRDGVDYILGSEEIEPGDGQTYDEFLAFVAKKPAMGGEELTRGAIDVFSDHYKKKKRGSTQSVVRASALAKLPALTNAFAETLMASGEKALAKDSRTKATRFNLTYNRDLHHFAALVADGTKSVAVKNAAQSLMSYITGELVIYSRANNDPGGTPSGPRNYAQIRGIAAYFPPDTSGPGYQDLAWAKVSKWDELSVWMNKP